MFEHSLRCVVHRAAHAPPKDFKTNAPRAKSSGVGVAEARDGFPRRERKGEEAVGRGQNPGGCFLVGIFLW